MAYYNERRTVEELVLPLAFVAVVKDGIPDEFAGKRDEMSGLFDKAAEEVLPKAMTAKERTRLFYRLKDVILNCVTTPARHYSDPAAKLALSLYYFLRNMVDQGAYVISDESKFSKALDMFLPTVDPWLDQPRFVRSAYKEGRRILTRMQQAGYFSDVEWTLKGYDN